MSATSEAVTREPTLVLDLDGYEGPLDLLLQLARSQKVDLTRLSVMQLADQYIAFIEGMRSMRIEVAADHLVMAAWLAFLKSRLLLPVRPAEEDDPSGEEMAALLQLRLQRLEAMREAAKALLARPLLGRDVFARGAPEPLAPAPRPQWQASLYDLLTAYAGHRERSVVPTVRIAKRTVWSLQDARDRLMRLLGTAHDWIGLDEHLSAWISASEDRTTARASSFAAMLELVKEGQVELSQGKAFSPLRLRLRQRREARGAA